MLHGFGIRLGCRAGFAVSLEQRAGRLIRSHATAEPEVDPARVEGLENRYLLGDQERRVVRQEHAAADANRLGPRAHRGRKDGGLARHDRGDVVMLAQPVAVVAELLGVLRERESATKTRSPPTGSCG